MPPRDKIQPFPGADPAVRIAPVECNVQIDNAEFDYRARVRSVVQEFQDRLYGIARDADWDRVRTHFEKQLTGSWSVVDTSPELEKAYRSVIWRSSGWPRRYLSIALLTRRGCLANLPFKLLIVSVPRGGRSFD